MAIIQPENRAMKEAAIQWTVSKNLKSDYTESLLL